MSRVPTESLLRDWRFGQIVAERLCAALLHLEGFTSVDPQCPLGGPDGRKDIVCLKGDLKVVAACYFPPTHQDFGSVREKFKHDLAGVEINKAKGFVFFVNQPVTPTQRLELDRLADLELVEVFHLERIRALLDSPKGYGHRLEYLRVSMSEEEQLAFWSTFNSSMNDRLVTFESGVDELKHKLEQVLARTRAMHQDLLAAPSSTSKGCSVASSFPTEQISVSVVMWLHRLIAESESPRILGAGELRGVQVWIGGEGSTQQTATFLPPAPAEVLSQLEELLSHWRSHYILHSAALFEDRLEAIVDFHHRFLSIHPFLDGNGRVARAILEQQVLELLGRRVSSDFLSNPGDYYAFLREADNGNLLPLTQLVQASVISG